MLDTYLIRKNYVKEGYSIPYGTIEKLCDEIDRLRGKEVKPQGKTVRVRIPCVVGTKGGWVGGGTSKGLLSFLTDQTPEDQAASMLDGFERGTGGKGVIRWLTADLPVPEEVEVRAEVENG